MEKTNTLAPWKFILYLGTLIILLCKYIYLELIDIHVMRQFNGFPVCDALLGMIFGLAYFIVMPSLFTRYARALRVLAIIVFVSSTLKLLSVSFK